MNGRTLLSLGAVALLAYFLGNFTPLIGWVFGFYRKNLLFALIGSAFANVIWVLATAVYTSVTCQPSIWNLWCIGATAGLAGTLLTIFPGLAIGAVFGILGWIPGRWAAPKP